MTQWKRSLVATAASALAIAAIPGALLIIAPTGVANADVCASAGRRVQVSGCANLAAARLLRPDAVRPAAATERDRMRQLQRQVGQRRRVQLEGSFADSRYRGLSLKMGICRPTGAVLAV